MYKYVIEVDKEIEHICDWIKEYFVKNGPNAKAVVGMSGGKDSTITAALLCKALGSDRVYGVIMPDGDMKDKQLAIDICEHFNMNHRVVDIGAITSAFYNAFGNECENNNRITTNTPARIRMAVLYAVAAEIGGRVVNTCNKSEDYVGFSTKYGDLAGDFSVLQDYPVRWVKEIGDGLNVPQRWVYKTPDDGMCGLSDEDKFGFTYETLDAYLIDDVVPDYDVYKKIQTMHNSNTHKECIKLPQPRVKTRHRYGEEYHECELLIF